jgi:predicted PhzF superfamily epimerase YddE/YHI9
MIFGASIMNRHFVTVDVFTDRKFGGNPLAVVLDTKRPFDRARASHRRPRA